MMCSRGVCINKLPVVLEDTGAVVGLSELTLDYIANGFETGELVVAPIPSSMGMVCCFFASEEDQAALASQKELLLSVARRLGCRGAVVLGIQSIDFSALRDGAAVRAPFNLDLATTYLVYSDTEGTVKRCMEELKGQLIFACETSISNHGGQEVAGGKRRKPK